MRALRPTVTLVAVGLTIATTASADALQTFFPTQLQRETLDLKQRQSQASANLERDARGRLDLYHLQMRQQREQQQLQELHRMKLTGTHSAPDSRRRYQQQILRQERQQQMQRFGRELEPWRAQQQEAAQ